LCKSGFERLVVRPIGFCNLYLFDIILHAFPLISELAGASRAPKSQFELCVHSPHLHLSLSSVPPLTTSIMHPTYAQTCQTQSGTQTHSQLSPTPPFRTHYCAQPRYWPFHSPFAYRATDQSQLLTYPLMDWVSECLVCWVGWAQCWHGRGLDGM
jgi:hypothetical protein